MEGLRRRQFESTYMCLLDPLVNEDIFLYIANVGRFGPKEIGRLILTNKSINACLLSPKAKDYIERHLYDNFSSRMLSTLDGIKQYLDDFYNDNMVWGRAAESKKSCETYLFGSRAGSPLVLIVRVDYLRESRRKQAMTRVYAFRFFLGKTECSDPMDDLDFTCYCGHCDTSNYASLRWTESGDGKCTRLRKDESVTKPFQKVMTDGYTFGNVLTQANLDEHIAESPSQLSDKRFLVKIPIVSNGIAELLNTYLRVEPNRGECNWHYAYLDKKTVKITDSTIQLHPYLTKTSGGTINDM
jgi:hypothetical protein